MTVQNQAHRSAVSTKSELRDVLEAKGFHCREDRDAVYCKKRIGSDRGGNTWTENVQVEVDAEANF